MGRRYAVQSVGFGRHATAAPCELADRHGARPDAAFRRAGVARAAHQYSGLARQLGRRQIEQRPARLDADDGARQAQRQFAGQPVIVGRDEAGVRREAASRCHIARQIVPPRHADEREIQVARQAQRRGGGLDEEQHRDIAMPSAVALRQYGTPASAAASAALG